MAHILLVMDDALEATHAVVTDAQRNLEHPYEVLRENRGGSISIKGDTSSAGKIRVDDEGKVVRMDRVEAVRAAIANGTYHVSAQELADKILHSMLR